MGVHAMQRCVWHLVWDRMGDRAGGEGVCVGRRSHVMVVVVVVIWTRARGVRGGRVVLGGLCGLGVCVCIEHFQTSIMAS